MKKNDTEENESFEHETSELIKKVDGYFTESKGYRDAFEKDWKQYENFYDGKQWQYSDGIRPVKNHVFAIIEGQLPTLAEAMPAVDILPIDEQGFDKAKMLSSALSWTFEKQSLQLKNTQVFRSLLKTGTAFLYVDFDPELSNGLGDVTIKELDWRHCYPDPNAVNIEDALYFGIRIPMRAVDIKRKFPAFEDEIESQEMSINGETDTNDKFIREDRWDGYGGFNDNGKDFKLDDMVIYEEMWHKDYETVVADPEETLNEIAKEAEEFMTAKAPDISQYEDHDSHIQAHEELKQTLLMEAAARALQLPLEMISEQDLEQVKQLPEIALLLSLMDDHIEAHYEYKKINPSGQKPKYKQNLRLTIKIGKTVLYDGDPPVDDGMIPIAPAYCYKDNKSIYGTGDVKNIIDSQKEHNELGWYELQGLSLGNNSPWLVDEEAQVDADTLSNDPGLIIKKRAAGQIQRMPPAVVSPQLAQKQAQNENEMAAIAGVNDVSQGRLPSGLTAARAVEALQQAANGRMRLKGAMYEHYTLPRVGKLCLSRIIKYWNTERMLRLYDDNGKIQFIKFDPRDLQNFEYDMKVVKGTTVGYSKPELFAFMSNLVDTGKIPAKVLFQTVDVPGRSKILESIEEEDQKNILIQELQAQLAEFQQLLQPAPNNGQAAK